MRYVCLVYGQERDLHALTKEGLATLDSRSLAHDRSLAESGHLVIAQALQSVRTSKTVRRQADIAGTGHEQVYGRFAVRFQSVRHVRVPVLDFRRLLLCNRPDTSHPGAAK